MTFFGVYIIFFEPKVEKRLRLEAKAASEALNATPAAESPAEESPVADTAELPSQPTAEEPKEDSENE